MAETELALSLLALSIGSDRLPDGQALPSIQAVVIKRHTSHCFRSGNKMETFNHPARRYERTKSDELGL